MESINYDVSLSYAQIGTAGKLNEEMFSSRLGELTIRVLIPTLFRDLGICKEEADRCERDGTPSACRDAAEAARTASRAEKARAEKARAEKARAATAAEKATRAATAAEKAARAATAAERAAWAAQAMQAEIRAEKAAEASVEAWAAAWAAKAAEVSWDAQAALEVVTWAAPGADRDKFFKLSASLCLLALKEQGFAGERRNKLMR